MMAGQDTGGEISSASAVGVEAIPAPSASPAAKSRRPYVWTPPKVPTWADLRAGGEARKEWIRYWRAAGPKDLADFALHYFFRLLPIDLCSAIGGYVGRWVGWRFHADAVRRARQNLKRIDPTLSDAEVERRVGSHFENAGRVMAEFSILHRLVKAGRITVDNSEAPLRRRAEGPLIFVACHTGNWEAMGALLFSLGLDWSAVYTPVRSPAQHVIANRVRRRFGVRMLPPGKAGVRPTVRVLEEGGAVSMFCDEVHHGKVMAPFFDRAPHVNGNLAIALRLSRMTGAQIFVGHCVRLGGCRFHVTCSDPVVLPSHADPAATLLDDAIALNAVIEPIIRAHCDQWYFLDNQFE